MISYTAHGLYLLTLGPILIMSLHCVFMDEKFCSLMSSNRYILSRLNMQRMPLRHAFRISVSNLRRSLSQHSGLERNWLGTYRGRFRWVTDCKWGKHSSSQIKWALSKFNSKCDHRIKSLAYASPNCMAWSRQHIDDWHPFLSFLN